MSKWRDEAEKLDEEINRLSECIRCECSRTVNNGARVNKTPAIVSSRMGECPQVPKAAQLSSPSGSKSKKMVSSSAGYATQKVQPKTTTKCQMKKTVQLPDGKNEPPARPESQSSSKTTAHNSKPPTQKVWADILLEGQRDVGRPSKPLKENVIDDLHTCKTTLPQLDFKNEINPLSLLEAIVWELLEAAKRRGDRLSFSVLEEMGQTLHGSLTRKQSNDEAMVRCSKEPPRSKVASREKIVVEYLEEQAIEGLRRRLKDNEIRYKNMKSTMEKECGKLKAENDSIRTELREKNVSLTAAMEKASGLEEKLSDALHSKEVLTFEIARLTEKVMGRISLNADNRQTCLELAQARMELAEMKTRMMEMSTENSRLKAINELLEIERDKAIAAVSLYEQELTSLKTLLRRENFLSSVTKTRDDTASSLDSTLESKKRLVTSSPQTSMVHSNPSSGRNENYEKQWSSLKNDCQRFFNQIKPQAKKLDTQMKKIDTSFMSSQWSDLHSGSVADSEGPSFSSDL